ncbi:S41 family peptidase [Sphingomicrobium marinum]|uniref:S41 family peptidase n=1 Tax=Sphingomicrobium marinum TaxID=1227950 RepID=UPI0022406A07|nr:S41 family peptidase [Sphingomicrobium marinum]
MLASCGGSSSSSGPIAGGGGGGGGGGGTDACALSARQAWVLEQMEEWYLFPDLLDTSVNPANYSDVQSYIDALVRPAREQGIDRNFTYITSIQEENDFIENATSADYGWRPVLFSNDRLYIRETYETAPSFQAGVDRGAEIVRLAAAGGTLRTPAQIIATDGVEFLSNLVFPSAEGDAIDIEFVDADGGPVQAATLTSTEYQLQPVSPRYGALVIGDTGYLNLRTFFADTAEADLTTAFQTFAAANVDNIIVDVRYNGGGLVRVADHLGDLLGRNRSGQVFSRTTFRASKASNNSTEFFEPLSASQDPVRLSFITTNRSASASELVANSMASYYGTNSAIVGSNTFGKPVGQIALDRAECDDRLRVVAFRTENADGEGDYYNGLATTYPVTCAASDDIFEMFGDPAEASTAKALDFSASGQAACTPITGAVGTRSALEQRLMPTSPTVAQRVTLGML